MRLVLGSIFPEPGYRFSVSHKVLNFTREQLIKDIMEAYGLVDQRPEWFLSIDDSTDSKTTQLEVKGPDLDKRNKFFNYTIWLPYQAIEKSSDVHAQFLKYFFDGLVILFKTYDVKEEDLRKVQSIVEREVLGNSDYAYAAEQIPPPDLSDIELG